MAPKSTLQILKNLLEENNVVVSEIYHVFIQFSISYNCIDIGTSGPASMHAPGSRKIG